MSSTTVLLSSRTFMACSSQHQPGMPCTEPSTSYDAVTVQETWGPFANLGSFYAIWRRP